MKTEFKDVGHHYKGVLMRTKMGDFPLIVYHNGEWLLDCIEYGAGAVEQDIKPILRPLSDMTEEEMIEWVCLRDSQILCNLGKHEIKKVSFRRPEESYNMVDVSWEKKHGTGASLGCDTYLFNRMDRNQFLFLLSKHFDLFGLIESGQAIDATTLTPNPYNQY